VAAGGAQAHSAPIDRSRRVHRRKLLETLDRYEAVHPDEATIVARIRTLVRAHPDCLERTCRPGHVTGSTWIVSADHRRVLLTHHRRLDRWLQLGGHVDAEDEVHRAALREAREESGMESFSFVGPSRADRGGADEPLPFDVDVHPIPAHGGEPAHEHHDLRYLLVAAPGQKPRRSGESRDLRWIPVDDVERMTREESVLRLLRKARAILSAPVE